MVGAVEAFGVQRRRRARLQPGDCIDGPAIVEEFGSTTVVYPGLQLRVDGFGNLLLRRQGASP